MDVMCLQVGDKGQMYHNLLSIDHNHNYERDISRYMGTSGSFLSKIYYANI